MGIERTINRTPKRFAIVYEDGSIVYGGGPDEEMVDVVHRVPRTWLEAPTDGVQAVIAEDHDGPRTWRGQDHYFVLPCGTEFHSADDLGPYLRKRVGLVKFGLCLNEEDHRTITQIVKHVRAKWAQLWAE